MRTLRGSMTAVAVAIAVSAVAIPLALVPFSGGDDALLAASATESAAVRAVDRASGSPRALRSPSAADLARASASSDRAIPSAADPAADPTAALEIACEPAPGGQTGTAPSDSIAGGAIVGTSTEDLALFARAFNAIRVENCLDPVPLANFRYDACMEQRLVWMAEDPSTDPASAWGHEGSVRSDGAPSVGCDGNLAGGSDNSGETVAQKWWDSLAHRTSLFRPDIDSGTGGVCIDFAMTHGGVPNEPLDFTRAAARWRDC